MIRGVNSGLAEWIMGHYTFIDESTNIYLQWFLLKYFKKQSLKEEL